MVTTAGDKGASLGDELEVVDRVGGVGDGVEEFAGVAVPKADGAIVTAGDQHVTTSGKADAINRGGVAFESAALAGAEIPDREAAIVVADRQELIIGTESETADRAGVGHDRIEKGGGVRGGVNCPEFHRPATVSDRQLAAIGTDTNVTNIEIRRIFWFRGRAGSVTEGVGRVGDIGRGGAVLAVQNQPNPTGLIGEPNPTVTTGIDGVVDRETRPG